MILFDTPRRMFDEDRRGRLARFTRTSHCMSTLYGAEGTLELLAFGRRIGLRSDWLQRRGEPSEHFDLFDGAIDRARAAGALEVTPRELVRRVIRPKRVVELWPARKAVLRSMMLMAFLVAEHHKLTVAHNIRRALEAWDAFGPDVEVSIRSLIRDAIPRAALTSTPNLVRYLGFQPGGRKMRTGWVRSVASNVKAGCSTELGPKTLLLGANGSGKSTVVAAVELALTGRVSDVAGKDTVSTNAALMSLAPGRAGVLWSQVELDNDERASFRMQGGKGRGRAAEHVVPSCVDQARVFPLREVREAFGSPAKAREFLSKHAEEISDEDVIKVLPGPLHEFYKAALKSAPKGDGMARLRDVHERAKRKKLDTRSEAKGQSNAAEQVAVDAVPPTAAEVANAGEELRRAETRYNAVRRVLEVRSDIERLQGEIDAWTETLAQAKAQQDQLEAYRRGLALVGLLETAKARTLAVCPLCTAKVEPSFWVDREGKIRAIVEKKKPAGESVDAVASAERRLASARDNLERAEKLLATFDLPPDTTVSAEYVEACRALVEKSRTRVTELAVQTKQFESVQRVKDGAFEKEAESAKWEQLETATEKATAQLMKGQSVAFCKAVSKYLPKGESFIVQIGEGTTDTVLFGIERDGVPHTALSGAEWARVTAALAAAVAGDYAGVTIIVPEDRAFDRKTLRAVMVALGKAPCQVLMTSPIPPAGRTPAGWTVVNVEGVEAPTDDPTDDVDGSDEEVEVTEPSEEAPSDASFSAADAPALDEDAMNAMRAAMEQVIAADDADSEEIW